MTYSMEVLCNHFLVADFVFVSQCSSKLKKTKSNLLKKYFECRKKLFPHYYNSLDTTDPKMFKKKKSIKSGLISFYSSYCKKNQCKHSLETFFDQQFSKKEMYSFIWYSLHCTCHFLSKNYNRIVLAQYFESVRMLLQCPKCRKHFKSELKDQMNSENREDVYWSMFRIHNSVNKRNDKPLMKKSEYKYMYKSVL